MRVVYVVFEPSGGMRHYAESLHSAMAPVTHSTLVVPAELEKVTDSHRGWIRKLTQKYNPFYYWRMANVIARRSDPHLVHVTSATVGLIPFIAQLYRMRVKVIYTVHDPVPHERKKRFWDWLVEQYHYSFQMPWVLAKCSGIHLHSAIHSDMMVEKYGKRHTGRLYIVQHGGGAPRTVAAGEDIPKELEGENFIFTFLFFGRIEPYKGLGILLAAFKRLIDKKVLCRLIIAGSGVMHESTRLPSNQCIVINRFIKDSEIKSIFLCANVVVLPYLSATQSGVIPLASEFARPVICSCIGGLPEMVATGETGLIVPPGNVVALADAMESMANNPILVQKMGQKARVHMIEHFSWATVAKQHRARYENLLVGQEA